MLYQAVCKLTAFVRTHPIPLARSTVRPDAAGQVNMHFDVNINRFFPLTEPKLSPKNRDQGSNIHRC